jgi:uncharacterized Zn finger protein (UPF0148 family)
MSWQQLADIYREATDPHRQDRTAPLTACPRCGEPLNTGPTGDLHCPFDGWLSSRNSRLIT